MSSTVFTATYNLDADALAIDLEGSGPRRSARTEHLDERRFVDYDSVGRTITIELLDVSDGVVFDGLPEAGLVREVVGRLAADRGWSGRA